MNMAHTGEAPTLLRHGLFTARLALPIIVARAALLLMVTVDTIMVGRAGAAELAYFGLGVAPQVTLMLVAVGGLQATAVLASQALGANDPFRAGAVARAALVHGVLLGLAILVLSRFAEGFFLAVGQTPDLSAGASRVSSAFGYGMPGILVFVAGNLFLEATGRPKTGMVIMLLANLINIPLNAVFGFGWGGFVEPGGAEGIMTASSLARSFAGIAILVILMRAARRDDAFSLIPRRPPLAALAGALRDPDARELRRLGLPMGLAQGVESAAFATVVMMAGWLGTAQLAAYQTTMTLVSLAFMMAIGTAGATSIRVGRALGGGDTVGMRRAGWAGVLLGGLWPVPVAVLFVISPERAAMLISQDPATIEAASNALSVAAFMLCADASMVVAIGALRGLGDVWWPTLLQIAAFWCVAIPVAYVTAIALDLGAGGLIVGLISGVVVSLAGLCLRFAAKTRAPQPLRSP